ncbi:MAG: hypothetical protein CW342_06825 [Thermoactinomycetaceae bacterium]|nr:hypothetical protein [Bacillota bacterium]MBO2532598.1 hypothetical protein [Thermoactinomycetaceae bacterium]
MLLARGLPDFFLDESDRLEIPFLYKNKAAIPRPFDCETARKISKRLVFSSKRSKNVGEIFCFGWTRCR